MKPLILWLLLATVCIGQERSIVCIKMPNGRGSDGQRMSTAGTGSIVSVDPSKTLTSGKFSGWMQAKILTAAHVVEGEEPIYCHLRDGEATRLRVVKRGDVELDDIALCIGWVPPGYEPLPIADYDALNSVTVRGLAGLVPDWPVDARSLSGNRIGHTWSDGRAYYDATVSPGDSGGPILSEGKIVGVVSGGLMMRPSGKSTFQTWPLVSVTADRIREIVK